MIHSIQGTQVKMAEGQRAVIRMAAQEMALACLPDEIDCCPRGRGRILVEKTFHSSGGHRGFQLPAECVPSRLREEMDCRTETGRYGSTVRSPAADRFLNSINGSFAIRKQRVTRRKRSGLDIAIDVADDAQLAASEYSLVHNSSPVRRREGSARGRLNVLRQSLALRFREEEQSNQAQQENRAHITGCGAE